SEAYIIFNLFQNAYLEKSLDFASRVEKSFDANTNMPERGVKQAGFLVLYKTTMPGVLVETGFLSNTHEEAYLMSETGQDRIAFSIYRAFEEYRRASEGNIPETTAKEDSLFKKHPAVIRMEQEKVEQALKGDTFGYRSSKNQEQVTSGKIVSQNKTSKTGRADQKLKRNTIDERQSEDLVDVRQRKDNKALGDDSINKGKISKPSSKSVVQLNINTGLKFRVQFMTSDKEIPLSSSEFKEIPNVKKYIQNQIYKYTAGDEQTPRDAEKIRQIVAAKGYHDAFVLPFLNENRITMKDALIMIKNKQ
ncbi:MAG: N-acetylmuramoyl-L-alanine amidase, partial [Bacteroidota bacterium]|nr:N-acetylmuramoyl-L-alanine amidase [Bacteroidota bacterium]